VYAYDSKNGEEVVSAAFSGQPGDFRRFWIPVNPVFLDLLTTVTIHIHFLFCFVIIIAELIVSIYVSDIPQTFYNINSVIK
jgi:hypothetical protein